MYKLISNYLVHAEVWCMEEEPESTSVHVYDVKGDGIYRKTGLRNMVEVKTKQMCTKVNK